MSFIFSQALVEASSLAISWDTAVSAQSSANPTPKPCLWHDKTMAPSRLSRFGMTCKPLTDDRGAELLTWWLEDSRAKTSALPETVPELTENAAECGTTWPASLVKLDLATSSWKTAQHSLLGGWVEFSQTWPRWGLMRNGECWERPTLVHRTNGSASGSWPTPTVCGNYNRKGASATSGDGLATAVKLWRTPNAQVTAAKSTVVKLSGRKPSDPQVGLADQVAAVEREAYQAGQQTQPMRLNPEWVEWLMGWPIGHTDLKPLETDKFREWQQQHGSC